MKQRRSLNRLTRPVIEPGRNYDKRNHSRDTQFQVHPETIRQTYAFNESCQKTVPEAITSFLESENYEDAVRLAISLGGDADTLACITGGIAEAFYGSVPDAIANPALALLDDGLRKTVKRFCESHGIALPSHGE
jgi:ADP-ribosylglycohydrolase